MKSEMENKDWLNEFVSLKQINPANPFTVPAGYFEELIGNIQSRIAIESALNNEGDGFAVPEGYFDSLQQQIQSRIFVEEALGEPAEHFTVPEGYFNKLNESILNKTVNEGAAKTGGGIVRSLYASNFFKYATAACVTLALCGGILLSELTSSVVEHNGTFLHKQLSN